MLKIKKFSKSFFFHLLETLQKNGSDWYNSFSKFIIKFRKRKIILFIFILCYLGLNIDLVQLKFIFITVVEMLILGPHQDCVLSTLLSRAMEHTALSALSLLICTLKSDFMETKKKIIVCSTTVLQTSKSFLKVLIKRLTALWTVNDGP